MADGQEKVIVARSLLKHSQVRIENVNGKASFVLPDSIAKMVEEVYSFSLDQLRVGGDLPLHDLAIHMDQQASLEASASMASEQARVLKEIETMKFEVWYEQTSTKVRNWWFKAYKKWPTDKQVTGRLLERYGEEYTVRKQKLIELEASYRILNNVIRSAVIVKGDMLRSMRPLLQGQNGEGSYVAKIDVKVASKIRKELTTVSFKSPSNKKEKR